MPIQEGGRFTPNDRIVSPGVFTRENDLSGITQGVADIGAVVVAPFPKGPGFAPTLITNTTDLEAKFGVADGVFYGPYTAKEYLNQKGFVTICRVGGLTGYNQKQPLVIWAESGLDTGKGWQRNSSIGALSSGSSFVYPSGSLISGSTGYLAGLTLAATSVGTSASYYSSVAGTVSILSSSAIFTFAGTGIDATTGSTSVNSNSGSLFYSGKAVTFNFSGALAGTISTTISSSLGTNNIPTSITGTAASSSMLGYLVQSGTLVGTFANSVAIVGPEPFDSSATLISASFSVFTDSGCASPVMRVQGIVSGAFGQFNGTFLSDGNSPYVDSCGEYHDGTGSFKALAVLADTQWAGLNSSLEAPGFSGTSLLNTSSVCYANNSASVSFDSFNLLLSSSATAYGNYEFSLDNASSKYITNVFGNNPTVGNQSKYVVGEKKEVGYLYSIFEDSIAEVVANSKNWRIRVSTLPEASIEGSNFSGNAPLQFTDDYSLQPTKGDSQYSLTHAYTPWIVSQAVAGVNGSSHRFPLFKVHTLSDGTNTNTSYKLEISNVRLAGTVPGTDWGTFTLSLREYSDTENRPKYIESYQNLTLDPDSANYIARRIGDRYNYITFAGKIIEFGTYSNLSRHIRIEMTENNYPVSAVPYGFEAYLAPLAGDIAQITPALKFSKASVYSSAPGKYASGVVFGATLTSDSELTALYPTSSTGDLIYEDNKEYFTPIAANASVGLNTAFTLDTDYTSNGVATSALLVEFGDNETAMSNAVPSVVTANESTYVKMRKFVLGFQGGFDGQSPAIAINIGSDITAGNTQGLNCATVTSAGSVAYKQCIGALGNADEFDINLIVTPGIFHSQHSYVAQLAIEMCEARGDTFYIMDNVVFPRSNQSTGLIDAAIADVSTIDSNYVATYYPWIKILDTNLNKIISVPPSVVMPAIFASSDNSAAEWFAPAGLNRGGISQAVQVLDRLTFQERDTLYEGRVNPIAAFPGQGICVWGQKTLQIKSSALDRINVRRLLIALKKYIASTSKYLVFEQNVADTRNRFLSVVNPYLENVQQRAGLYAFKVVMDDTNNTADIIDNNILYGQIYLQPAKTAEFIVLDFNVLPTGASFPGA